MEPLFPPPPRPYSPYAPLRRRRNRQVPVPGRFGRGSGDARSMQHAEIEAEIERIARQLARVVQTVPWGRVQNDAWDSHCQFIFRLRTVDAVRARAREVADEQQLDGGAFVPYALRRWYCFWGARVAELLFLRHPGVVAGPPKDHEVDFTVDGVPFDLKTSEVPRQFVARLDEWLDDAAVAAAWFYTHQSRERRFHTANRLFLVLCDRDYPDEAWRLRADVSALRASVDAFMEKPRFIDLEFATPDGQRHQVTTGVIPVTPAAQPRQLRLDLGASPSPRRRVPDDDSQASGQLALPWNG